MLEKLILQDVSNSLQKLETKSNLIIIAMQLLGAKLNKLNLAV